MTKEEAELVRETMRITYEAMGIDAGVIDKHLPTVEQILAGPPPKPKEQP